MGLEINIFIRIFLFFIDEKMNILQIQISSEILVEWFNSLNIEFKVLISIVTIALGMVLTFILFRLFEVIFTILKAILLALFKIFRIPIKNRNKNLIKSQSSKEPIKSTSEKQEKNNSNEDDKSNNSESEEEEEESFQGDSRVSKKRFAANKKDSEEYIYEYSEQITHCLNCGTKFSQKSLSVIGDTRFITCEKCGKRYIINGDILIEKDENTE